MPPRPTPLRRRRALLLCLALALPAGPGAATSPMGPAWSAEPGQALLLGEVHDNARQHQLRAQALAALLARGSRPALLMEQFDREHQAALDAALAAAAQALGRTPGAAAAPAGPPVDAQAKPQAEAQADALPDAQVQAQVEVLVAAGQGGSGWHWPFYKPYLALALRHGLPVLAANVSRADARLVIRQGLAAQGFAAEVPADIAQAQAEAIVQSHCGQVDAATAGRLAQAQVARDQFMARLVAAHAPRGVVLLAGNGHVRADIGVPRWLAPALRARTQVVGALEPGDASDQAFDSVLRTPAQPRPDPCADLRMPTPPPRQSP